MTLFPSVLCIGGLAGTIAAATPAQTVSTTDGSPSEKTMQSWLISKDPRLVAWGAHDALLANDQALVPHLLSLASQWQPLSQQTSDTPDSIGFSAEQIDERDAMGAVLDGLIQMNVRVPAETLRVLAGDFGNEVAVFLSRMPPEEAVPLGLDFYRSLAKHSYGLQYVSASLLAVHPVPGFAGDLLSKISVRATVNVVFPGAGQMGGRRGRQLFLFSRNPS
jgi:hypothetical protein